MSRSGGGQNPVARVWPTGTDYSRAVQTPEMSFADPVLAAGRPGVNAMGMPMVASGQNAVVFLLVTQAGRHAVRCFLRPPHEGSVRYSALAAHLGESAPDALTAARWLDTGVKVDGVDWPVVVMPWVEGVPLNVAVENMLGDTGRLRQLRSDWLDVIRSLQQARIAHGDLQHGNVLVKPDGAIALVDLDGVWVPEIQVGPPAEFGHPNYQHPARSVHHWGEFVDSFPAALIELALAGLAADPSLERFLSGENLLFSRPDLERPASSEVWSALCACSDGEVAAMAESLRGRCEGAVADVLVPFDRVRGADAPVELDTTVVQWKESPSSEVADLPPPVAGESEWWKTPTAPQPSILPPVASAARPQQGSRTPSVTAKPSSLPATQVQPWPAWSWVILLVAVVMVVALIALSTAGGGSSPADDSPVEQGPSATRDVSLRRDTRGRDDLAYYAVVDGMDGDWYSMGFLGSPVARTCDVSRCA